MNNIRQLIDIVEGLQSLPANITVEPLEDGYGEQITVRITELGVPVDNVEITVDRDSNLTGNLTGDYLYAHDSPYSDGELSDDSIKSIEQELQDDPSITVYFEISSDDGTLLDNFVVDEDELRDTVSRIHYSTGTDTDILYGMIGVDDTDVKDDIKTVFEYLKNTIGTTYDEIYRHVSAPPDSLLGIE